MSAVRLVFYKQAGAIFAVEDRFARDRGTRGPRPGPIGDVTFYLTGSVNNVGDFEAFQTPRKLKITRNPSGYFVFFDQFEIGGREFQEALPEATYRLRVESQFYQVHEEDVALPDSDSAIPVDLEPNYAYPFPSDEAISRGRVTLLRGTVFDTSGAGVANLLVAVPGRSNIARTDDTGQWVLVFPDSYVGGTETVRFSWPDGGVVDVPSVEIVRGESRSLFQTGLRGQVLSDAGVALPGASISVAGQAGESVSRDNGSWFYYFGLNQAAATVNVTAELPDGNTRTRFGVTVQPRSVVVVPTFRFN